MFIETTLLTFCTMLYERSLPKVALPEMVACADVTVASAQ